MVETALERSFPGKPWGGTVVAAVDTEGQPRGAERVRQDQTEMSSGGARARPWAGVG